MVIFKWLPTSNPKKITKTKNNDIKSNQIKWKWMIRVFRLCTCLVAILKKGKKEEEYIQFLLLLFGCSSSPLQHDCGVILYSNFVRCSGLSYMLHSFRLYIILICVCYVMEAKCKCNAQRHSVCVCVCIPCAFFEIIIRIIIT